MSYRLNKLFSNPFEQSLGSIIGTIMGNNTSHQRKKISADKAIRKYGYRNVQEKGIMSVAIPKLSQMNILRHERAILVDSSTTTFGNEIIRLVNVAFHTSQLFPSMMGTCDTISRYLRKELIRQYPSQHFHIIIGDNDTFSFAISDRGHFAEIKQEQYRVLIFSTKRRKRERVDAHDANNQMKLQWQSVVINRLKN